MQQIKKKTMQKKKFMTEQTLVAKTKQTYEKRKAMKYVVIGMRGHGGGG